MLNTKKLWPFGLSSSYWARFIAIVLLVLCDLIFLDAPVATAVATWPEWIISLFALVTRIGDAEWIILPSLVIAIISAILMRTDLKFILAQTLMQWTASASFIFFVTAGPGLLANILKRLIGRARPIHLDELGLFHFQPVFNDWMFQSFPSGHTSTMFAFATGIMFLFPKLRWAAFALAAAVGLSRIIIGMHYPTDVFAGVLFGIIAAFAVRNIALSRDWIFVKNDKGEIVRKRSDL